MYSESSTSAESKKEPWEDEFRKEPINDERWNCIVTAFVESEIEDEGCLKLLTKSVSSGNMSLIYVITMSDLIWALKNGQQSVDTKKRDEKKQKRQDRKSLSGSCLPPKPRFPEVLQMISKEASYVEGQCRLSPRLMAYALKYLILVAKDQNCFEKKFKNALMRKRKEKRIKAALVRKLMNGVEEDIALSGLEDAMEDDNWNREKFDMFDRNPLKDGPLNGPDLYIILCHFYNPLYYVALQEINVPFIAIVRVETSKMYSSLSKSNIILNKSELIKYFWSELELSIQDGRTTNLYKDIALLKYVGPVQATASELTQTCLVNDIAAILYSTYNIQRLNQRYIEQTKICRVIENVEPLNLCTCEVYNNICNSLIIENNNAELYVLFSIIEQVAAGVPESNYLSQTNVPESSGENPSCIDKHAQMIYYKGRQNFECSRKNPVIYLYDDNISLNMLSIDQNILSTGTVFNRFIIRSLKSRILNEFPILTDSQKAYNEFQFLRMWEKNKEELDTFRVKLFFSIAMRLVERTKVIEEDCDDVSSEPEVISGSKYSNTKIDKSRTVNNIKQNFDLNTVIFQEVIELFYKLLASEKKISDISSKKTEKELKKVEAVWKLEINTNSFVEYEPPCNLHQKLDGTTDQKANGLQEELTYLEQFLDDQCISYLNEPNLLVTREEFHALIEKYKFFENLEPNRLAQRLQNVYDDYNTTEYSYFPPTDTLFILGYNNTNTRGIFHLNLSEFFSSQLALRDFVQYLLHSLRNWTEEEDSEYIIFLQGLRESKAEAERREEHKFKCEILKRYFSMADNEKPRFLELECKQLMNYEEDVTIDDLKELPVKPTQEPKGFTFTGFDFGGIMKQVDVKASEFHSTDGSMVGIRTQSWLYYNTLMTLKIRRLGSELYFHKWEEEEEVRCSLHFLNVGGIIVAFNIDPVSPLICKITWPNGLVIEPLPMKNRVDFYIKQSYLSLYRIEQDINTEESRCYIPNGQILVFHVNGTVEILCSGGVKYRCRVKESFVNDLEIIDMVSSTGELWVSDECSKCRKLIRTMTLLTGTDPETQETFYCRDDGAKYMLWPDGRLVTTYPDGTKITSVPRFQDFEITSEESEQGEESSDEDSSFILVTSSYLMEHPRYASVSFDDSKFSITMYDEMKFDGSFSGIFQIDSHHTVVKVSPISAEYYSMCNSCGKRSTSVIYFQHSKEEILCNTEDYLGKTFLVYGSGQVQQDENEKTLHEDGKTFEKPKYSTHTEQQSHVCEHHRLCKPTHRCLLLQRDLRGLEFISDNALYCYIGSLSHDAIYDISEQPKTTPYMQHGFFKPVYKIGRERYFMSYRENDNYPRRIKRKQIKVNFTKTRVISVPVSLNDNLSSIKEYPKVIIARFIKVLKPSPIELVQGVSKSILIYQRRTLEMTETCRKRSKEKKQTAFPQYVAKELQLIASTLCHSLDFYTHTCTVTPNTEQDIHTIAHRLDLRNEMFEISRNSFKQNILPQCKTIPKLMKYSAKPKVIPEFQ